jgi:Fe-Mn family superoxide dismutase
MTEFNVQLPLRSMVHMRSPRLAQSADAQRLIAESVAFVAQPKQFKLDSDSISQHAKQLHVELYSQHCEKFSRISAEMAAALGKGEYDRLLAGASHVASEQNSVWLHELFFSNCFCRHSQLAMSSMAYARLARDFGTFDDWQRDFISRHKLVHSGWIVTAYSFFLQRYVTTCVKDDDAMTLVGTYPVIVMDAYEHAYVLDYGNDRLKYVEAMMRELDWDVINERFARVEAMQAALR